MYIQELLFVLQGLLGMFMLMLLHKINQIKKQMDMITKEVTQYLAFLEEDEGAALLVENKKRELKVSKEEAQNHIIQAVLKEYFP